LARAGVEAVHEPRVDVDPEKLAASPIPYGTLAQLGAGVLHTLHLAHAAAGVRAAGGTPLEFNTIAVSDNLTQGTPGMRASLVSRELIADSVELVGLSQPFDGIVCLGG